MSNAGLIGFPAGTGVMDASSQAINGAVITGADLHRVNLSISVDALRPGFMFQWVPVDANTGPLFVLLNGQGPFQAFKPMVTRTADAPGAALLPLQPGDVVPGRTLVGILRNSGRGSFVVELVSGIVPPFGENGIQLALSPNAASSRGILGLASGATTTVGNVATRNVGTANGEVPIIVDGFANLDPGINVARKDLGNLTNPGRQRTVWAQVAFDGLTATEISAFNGALASRAGVGLYDITWPALAGFATWQVIPVMDTADTTANCKCTPISGTRTATSVRLSARSGNSSSDPFDPDRVTVSIFPIGG